MVLADILTVLTHNSGQVLATVVQAGLSPIDSIARTVSAATAVTNDLGIVFFKAILKGMA